VTLPDGSTYQSGVDMEQFGAVGMRG
jgi:hypothetical protein